MEPPSTTSLFDILYLPPVHYIAQLAHANTVTLEQWAPFLKGTYHNRCVIATSGGPLVLSVPLLSGKYLQPLCEVRIAYHEPWQRRHWRSIHDAYRKSPFFDHYADPLESYFRQEKEYLVEWNTGLLQLLLNSLRISQPLTFTEHFEPNPENRIDMRNAFAFKPRLQRPDPHYVPVSYVQVFQDRHEFMPNMSILDLLFCTGPEAPSILHRSIVQPPKTS